MVVGHKRYQTLSEDSGLDQRGHLIIRDVSAAGSIFDIELFLTDRRDGLWVFRKNATVTAQLEDAIVISPLGDPIFSSAICSAIQSLVFSKHGASAQRLSGRRRLPRRMLAN